MASGRNLLKKRDDLSSLNVEELEPSKNKAVRDRNIEKVRFYIFVRVGFTAKIYMLTWIVVIKYV